MSVPRPAMLVAIVIAVLAARLGDDLGFLRVILGVEDDVLDAAALEHAGEPLGLLDRHGADQRRASLGLPRDDVLDDRVPLLAFGAVDEVRFLDAPERSVGRDDVDVEVVDLARTPALRSRPCRSCPRASCTCGSSSGR